MTDECQVGSPRIKVQHQSEDVGDRWIEGLQTMEMLRTAQNRKMKTATMIKDKVLLRAIDVDATIHTIGQEMEMIV